MPTRKEASKVRSEFLVQREAIRKAKLAEMQDKLYNKIVDEWLMKYKDVYGRSAGTGSSSADLLRSLTELETIINKASFQGNPEVLRDVVSDSKMLSQYNMMYFSTMFDNPTKLNEINVKALDIINKQLGVNTDGTLKAKGFLDKMMASKNVSKLIAAEAKKAYTNGYDTQTFREKLKQIIVGAPKQNGILEQHFTTYAKDVLNSINGSNNNIYRKELGLQYAYYAGGLIKSSRALCIKNNGKIFSTEQIEALKKDPFILKMYGPNIEDYNPYELPGGYGCLHNWDWITNDLAEGHIREQNKKAAERNAAFKDRHGL